MSAEAPGVHFESYIIKEVKGLTFGIILKWQPNAKYIQLDFFHLMRKYKYIKNIERDTSSDNVISSPDIKNANYHTEETKQTHKCQQTLNTSTHTINNACIQSIKTLKHCKYLFKMNLLHN